MLENKRKGMARPGFESRLSRSEVDLANRYSIGPLLENWEIYLSNIHPTEVEWVFLIHFQKSFFQKIL